MALKSIKELDEKLTSFTQRQNGRLDEMKKLLRDLTAQIRTGGFTNSRGMKATDLPAYKAAEEHLSRARA